MRPLAKSPSRVGRSRLKRGRKAENGDRVTIDFTGKMDGTPFQGGTGGDVSLASRSGSFIPGFEEQLVGIAAGEQRTVNVTSRRPIRPRHLAGKNAEFDVTAKAVEAPQPITQRRVRQIGGA